MSAADEADLRRRLTLAVRRAVPGWLADQTDDLVQSCAERIVRGYTGAQLNTSFLYRVAHSVVVDEIRRRRRRPEVELDEGGPDHLEHGGDPGPEGLLQGQELGQQVMSCLAELSPDRRRVVTLYLVGHPSAEIATLLGLEKRQTENLVSRGMKDLREALARQGVTP